MHPETTIETIICWRCKGKRKYKTRSNRTIDCPVCDGKGSRTQQEIIQDYFEKIKGGVGRSTNTESEYLNLPNKRFKCESCLQIYSEILLHHPIFLHEEITGRQDVYPCDVLAVSKRYAHEEICIFCLEGNPPGGTNDMESQVANVERYFKSQDRNMKIAQTIINNSKRGI